MVIQLNNFKFNIGASVLHSVYEHGVVKEVVDSQTRLVNFADYDHTGELLGNIDLKIHVDQLKTC